MSVETSQKIIRHVGVILERQTSPQAVFSVWMILPSEMPTKKAFWDLTNMTSGFATMCSRGRRKFLKVSKTLSKHRGMSWKKFYDHTTLQKNYIET